MFRGLVLAVAIVGLVAVGLVGGQQTAEAQQTASATRSFSPSQVESGGTLTVTIRVADYGALGQLTEEFPGDFTFVESSPEVTPSGQTLTFNLLADTSVSYTLRAPATTETISISGFSGNLEPAEGEGVTVGGPSLVTVSAPAQQTASATRSFSPSQVESGGTLTVTIRVADYGALGQLTEEFPGDFTFVESSPEVTPSGQTLTFNLLADTSVSYTLRAPATTETISISGFSGNLEPAEGEGVTVGGPSSVTVSAPAQQTASATRSFSPSQVESGGTLTVTIRVADYGALGQLTEEFPGDFTFVESSPEVTPSGQTLTFNLLADTSVSYTLRAPATTETISISGFMGNLEPAEGDGVRVGGPSSVRVGSPRPQPTPTDTAPAFRTAPAVSVKENSTTVTAVRAEDRDSQDSVTGYDITGGADQDKFSLTTTRVLSFITAPDFEDPTDADADNQYVVEVTATSGTGSRERTADRTFTVTVTNEEEAGMVTLSEMQPVVGRPITAMLSDDDEPVADTVMWQWKSSDAMGGTFNDITDATMDSYTPVDGDVDMYLMATVMYDDGHGMDKDAMSMATDNPVVVAPTDMCLEPLGMLPYTVMDAWASDCMSEAKSGSYARYYSFTLSAAQAGYVEMNLTSGADPYLALRAGEGRTGRLVASNDNVGSRNFNSAINMMLDAGTYTVEATTYFAGQTGDFTLSVRPLQETEVLGPLTGSVDRSNSRWTSDHMSTQQEGSYARSYTFTLTEATHVAINLTAPEDPYLFLLDSSGTVVHESDNITTRNLNSRIDETLQPGRYTIEATTYFPARTGTFHLSIGVIP